MTTATIDVNSFLAAIRETESIRLTGRVADTVGLIIESRGPAVSVGESCLIDAGSPARRIRAEVVGFRGDRVLLMALDDTAGVAPGSRVEALGRPIEAGVGDALLGRVIDGLGAPIDGLGEIRTDTRRPLAADPPGPMTRRRISVPLATGIRSIDGLLTCGRGQRVGIFAGSGVGKSTVLGMIARNCEADLNVIALVGERGREVRDFIERDLGEEGLAKSVVVAVTSDQPAILRLKGALLATAIAEHFRDLGKDVMLLMDSVTRVAMAQREVGLAAGEPPATKGYPPSVFALLPKLLERSGTSREGSITGLYTVLVEGDDMNDPVADTARSILDGHIVLSRKLAAANHYPPVDVLESVSRLMGDVTDEEHRLAAAAVRELLGTYREAEDLINIGAYVKGSNPRIDRAISRIESIRMFLTQRVEEETEFAETVRSVLGLAGQAGQ